jgi:citrate synthase
MLDAAGRADYRPNPRLARALDVLFLLHAEHELNCSTSAARHLASSGVDVYTAVMVRAVDVRLDSIIQIIIDYIIN